MKILSDREFRNEPNKVRRAMAGQNVVMTSRGKPYAVMLPVQDEEEVEYILELADRIKAQMALSSVRKKAAETGLNRINAREIDEEIRQVRFGIRLISPRQFYEEACR
ncbi:MAG: type II toxin-antitoxin system prevent-host-death family antitoxin [Desulfonatronovibrio sp.]